MWDLFLFEPFSFGLGLGYSPTLEPGSWRLLCQVCPHNPGRTQTPGSHYCWQMEEAPSVLECPWDFKVQLNLSWAHLKAPKSVILINSLSLLWLLVFIFFFKVVWDRRAIWKHDSNICWQYWHFSLEAVPVHTPAIRGIYNTKTNTNLFLLLSLVKI